MFSRGAIFSFFSLFIISLSAQQIPSQRQEIIVATRGKNHLYFSGSLGSIYKSATPSNGKVHLSGSFRISNADYTRSSFDGVPEALNSIGFSTGISSIFQLYRNTHNNSQLSLTIGSQQSLTTGKLSGNFGLNAWYESNYYAGILFATTKELSFCITYLMAVAPNVAAYAQEFDIAMAYFSTNRVGNWKPSVEISIPFAQSDGFLLQILLTPTIISLFKQSSWPLAIGLPVKAGAGLFGYHVNHDNFTGYISFGLVAQLGLKNIGIDFGNWDISLGADLVIRDSKIANLSPQDKAGNLVIIAGLGISFLY
jgi:hypothetical protein